jgi:poly(A)-specific ribonuclease
MVLPERWCVLSLPLWGHGYGRLTLKIAVEFLHQNGFQFDLPFTSGIPYLSHDDEKEVRGRWIARDNEMAALTDMSMKAEDGPLVEHARTAINLWRSQPADTRDDYLNIPSIREDEPLASGVPRTLNKYHVRLMHQIVRNEFPDLKSNGKGHFIQLSMLDAEREEKQKAVRARYRDRDISRATEFRWIIDALSGRDISGIQDSDFLAAMPKSKNGKPPTAAELANFKLNLEDKLKKRRRILVGHNCFTDLLYLYTCFVGKLPDRVEDFQQSINELFPAIVDTKNLASHGKDWSDTSLGSVEEELQKESSPKTEVPAEYDRYLNTTRYHEAGFDSLLTAKVAIKLSARLEKEKGYPVQTVRSLGADVGDDKSNDHYETAPESIASTDSIVTNVTSAIARLSPVSAIANYFWPDSAATEPAQPKGPVVAVKEQLAKWSKQDEIETVRTQMAQTSIADVLSFPRASAEPLQSNVQIPAKGPETQPARDSPPDLISFSDEEGKSKESTSGSIEYQEPSTPSDFSEDTAQLLTEADIAARVDRGELMPRWDGGRGFWTFFGNQLRVNSCEEPTMRLGKLASTEG